MNEIRRYYQAIKDGSVTVGKWVRLVYEYIIKGLEDGLFLFDQKKATAAVKFIEQRRKLLRQTFLIVEQRAVEVGYNDFDI